MIMDGHPLVSATATYHPSMIADGIRYAIDVATGVKSSDFHTAKAPITVVIPSVLVDKTNVAKFYEPESIY
jgi:ribose transport system substrate-binding protein